MAPTATEVARRLAALKVVALYAIHAPPRGKLAELAKGWSPSEKHAFEAQANADRDAYWKKVKEAGLYAELTPKERAFALTTVATMTARQQLDAAWHTEAIAILLWALGARDSLPNYDGPVDNDIVNVTAAEGAVLRSEEQIEVARSVAELWHWRANLRERADKGIPVALTAAMRTAGIKTYDELVAHTAAGAFEKGHIPAPLAGDFAVNGRAFRTLSKGAWTAVQTMAEERHHALNWLAGKAPSNRWDDTPVDA